MLQRTSVLALASAFVLIGGDARAELSANVGWVSDYYYRGLFQARSSASAGLDWSGGGFYAGTWAADLDQGLEVDGYFGYGQDVGPATVSVGFTGY